MDAGLAFLPALLHIGPGLTAGNLGFEAGKNLLSAFLCTGVFALYERRRIDSYGLAKPWLFRWQALDGAAAGILMTAFVVSSMLVLGGMQIRGLAGTGSALARSALAWLLANICVGLAEEFWWRSYLQVTLWKAIGFWPAATIIALLFTADHYFFKQGENIWDVTSLIALSLLMSTAFGAPVRFGLPLAFILPSTTCNCLSSEHPMAPVCQWDDSWTCSSLVLRG